MAHAAPNAANYSQAELDKFGALANRWWDPQGPQRPLHELNPARLGYVRDRIPLRGARVLDVGCGGGLLSEALAAEAPASFDAITCMEMLEHVPDPGSVLAACATLLKPGGRLFLSTLNRTPAAFAIAIHGAE
jgi:2-polyprenyl-6-hydroxyphenyl methylase/3-demethylubiquinone-9 3-methyltransferase